MKNKEQSDEFGILEVELFTPEDIKNYSAKNYMHPDTEESFTHQQIDESINQFIRTLKMIKEKVETSNLKESAKEAINELSDTLKLLNEHFSTENPIVNEENKGKLFAALTRMINQQSPCLTLLKNHGNNEKLVESLQMNAGLISGLLTNPTQTLKIDPSAPPLPGMSH